MDDKSNLDTATFGSGCFWCTEAIFVKLKGVHSVVSGYSGGTKEYRLMTGLHGKTGTQKFAKFPLIQK